MDLNSINNYYHMEYTEKAVSSLKSLYERYGYSKYKMSKFEEYDLYVRNKSFLVSDHIITFTDTDGKLMALKPDVTLSIVKNSQKQGKELNKVYYHENVYRVPRGSFSFKEIMQTGLECIGELDTYSMAEVLMLAVKSLETVSDDYVLDVSHMGIISTLVDSLGLSNDGRAKVLTCVGEKNLHGIDAVCIVEEADACAADTLKKLLSINGSVSEMLEILKDSSAYADACEMADIIKALGDKGEKVRVDFSVTDDMKYYCGIVFKGFVKGIPTSVLSGGRYDNLLRKMGKKAGAIGFAVYLDFLNELDSNADEFDVDVAIVYDNGTDVGELMKLSDNMVSEGKRIAVKREIPDKLKYQKLIDLRKEGK